MQTNGRHLCQMEQERENAIRLRLRSQVCDGNPERQMPESIMVNPSERISAPEIPFG